MVETGALEKVDFFVQDLQVFGFDVGRDVDLRGTFAHLGLYEFLSLLTRHRDAMVAVHHEIDFPDFVQHHRRQADILVEGAADPLPAAGGIVLSGQEGAVEGEIAVEASRHLVETNRLNAAIDGAADMQSLADFVIRKQVRGLSGKDCPDAVEKGFGAGAAVIHAGTVGIYFTHLISIT